MTKPQQHRRADDVSTAVRYALYFTSFLALALCCSAKAFRRGEKQRSLTLAAALVLLLVHSLVDMVRDMIGGA